MKNSFYFLLMGLFLVYSLLLTSCTPAAAPTRGYDRERPSAPYDLKITAIVTRARQQSVNDIAITATTGSNRMTDTTSHNGAVSLKLPYTPGDSIDFEFRQGKEYWIEKSSNIPIGANAIKVYFQLDDAGVVSFSRMEY